MNRYNLAAAALICFSIGGIVTSLNLRYFYQMILEHKKERRVKYYRSGNATFREGPTTPKPAIEPKGQRPRRLHPHPDRGGRTQSTATLSMSQSKSPLVFETFRQIDRIERAALTLNKPLVVNGLVQVKRYRVTIEEIEEPDEVICSRLQRLWDENGNHHNLRDLERYAKQYGYQFKVKS